MILIAVIATNYLEFCFFLFKSKSKGNADNGIHTYLASFHRFSAIVKKSCAYIILQHRIDVNNVQLAQLIGHMHGLIPNQASPRIKSNSQLNLAKTSINF